jgi:magnesium-transporting ATPase (P-type)
LLNPQVLYVNLITAVTLGMMLAAEPAEATVMDRQPRRPGKRLLGKIVIWRIFFVCTLMVIIIECFYYWGEVLGEPLCMRRAEAFNVLVFMEMSYAWTCRYIKEPSYHKRSLTENPWCYASLVVTAGLQVFLTYTPGVNKFFGMCGMGGWAWLRTIVAMIVVYIIVEIEKALVDPLLMPMVRPVLTWVEKHTPKFLRTSELVHAKEQVRAKDHPSHSHQYTSPEASQVAVQGNECGDVGHGGV